MRQHASVVAQPPAKVEHDSQATLQRGSSLCGPSSNNRFAAKKWRPRWKTFRLISKLDPRGRANREPLADSVFSKEFSAIYGSWVSQLLVVMFGGALGALVRFLVSAGMASLKWGEFPWGTLLVNVVGCLLIGVLFVASQREMPQLVKLALGIGFLGALTTFSTFSLDTLLIWQKGRWAIATVYAMGSLGLGLLAVIIGQMLGNWWLGDVAQ